MFQIGDRVYYRDNGEDDKGIVVRVDSEGVWVSFDTDPSPIVDDAFEPHQLAHVRA